MTDVFLSYKAEDRPRVAPLVAALESDGLSVWWDAHIGGGADWRDTIQRNLDAAACVLVAWSKRSVGPNGQFVRDEASRALRRGVYLPVRIDKVEPPLGFGESQALPLSGWKGDRHDPRYQTILAAVRGIVGHAHVADQFHAPAVSRRAVIAGGAAVAASAVGLGGWWLAKPAAAASDSIAVLPFANLSGDPAQAYFSDGMAEELRSALSRIARLKVMARTSSEVVRDADAKTAAHKLHVANILTGSVRRSPTTIRVGAQLVGGKDGLERWSQVYDRPTGDALQIQTDIADNVARALSIQLGVADRSRLSEGETSDAAAQDLLLKARANFVQDDSRASLDRALAMIDSALALDPNYAEAVAAKAGMLTIRAGVHSKTGAESRAIYAKAATEARRAIRLAPNSRLGYWALANILDQQLFLRPALAQFDKMRSLPGNDGLTLPSYAIFLSEIGRDSQALQVADEAVGIDPLNPQSYMSKAVVLAQARRYPEALGAAQRAIDLAPDLTWPRAGHANMQMLSGRNAEARAEFNALKEERIGWMAWKAILAARQGDLAESERIARALSGDAAYYQQAEILAQQGRKDDAIAALEKAWTARDPGLTMLLVDPYVDPLRSDPRFKAIFKRLDFPDR